MQDKGNRHGHATFPSRVPRKTTQVDYDNGECKPSKELFHNFCNATILPFCQFLDVNTNILPRCLTMNNGSNPRPCICSGRKTFPASRGTTRRPQLSPSMMRKDDYGSQHSSRTSSNQSISKSSSSSGIVPDDPPSARSRRDSELEHAIMSLQELGMKDNAKCEWGFVYFILLTTRSSGQ